MIHIIQSVPVVGRFDNFGPLIQVPIAKPKGEQRQRDFGGEEKLLGARFARFH